MVNIVQTDKIKANILLKMEQRETVKVTSDYSGGGIICRIVDGEAM